MKRPAPHQAGRIYRTGFDAKAFGQDPHPVKNRVGFDLLQELAALRRQEHDHLSAAEHRFMQADRANEAAKRRARGLGDRS